MDATKMLVYCGLIIFGIILFPIIVQEIASTNMTVWTFSGHEGVAAFLTAFPYVFLLGMVMVPVYMMIKERLHD